MLLFLDISGGEILLVVLAGMLLFGKDKLPGIVRGIARGADYIKKTSEEVKQQIHSETGWSDAVSQMRDEMENAARSVKQDVQDVIGTVGSIDADGISPDDSLAPGSDGTASPGTSSSSHRKDRTSTSPSSSTDDHVADA